jgi:cephalosporin-C deacetylase-like acetyl esterase
VPGIDPKTGTPLYETIQEDWSSLAIGTSKLEPEKPMVGSTEEEATFTRTLVQLQWRPGDPLDLWILLPKGVTKPPVVLYLYGYDQDTGRFKNDRWAARATTGGVAAVGFVSALTGHRFHDRPMKQWFVSELQESVGSTVHDVKFILDYLAQRGDVDMNRVGMFGEGSGGTIAILAAAADPRIKAVDTLEPWGDWPEFLAKSAVVAHDPDQADYVKPDFLKRVAPLDPVKWLPELKVPVRIQQVKEGDTTPMEVKEAVANAAPKKASIMRFETDSDMSDREGGGRLFDWIKEQLLEPAKTDGGSGNASVADGKTTTSNGSPSSQR